MRAELSAEFAEEERRQVEQLNHLLRHDILNAVMVIRGRAELLLDELSEERHATQLETIRRQSLVVTELIQNVRVLVEAETRDHPLGSVELVALLESEVASLAEVYPGAEIELIAPESATVRANRLVSSIFTNLIRNAVVHNDAETPRVRVGVDASDARVLVHVSDNGPGLPAHVEETLFEPKQHADHGVGLHLVRILVDRYDGAVSLDSTGPQGTAFTVELSAATAAQTAGASA